MKCQPRWLLTQQKWWRRRLSRSLRWLASLHHACSRLNGARMACSLFRFLIRWQGQKRNKQFSTVLPTQLYMWKLFGAEAAQGLGLPDDLHEFLSWHSLCRSQMSKTRHASIVEGRAIWQRSAVIVAKRVMWQKTGVEGPNETGDEVGWDGIEEVLWDGTPWKTLLPFPSFAVCSLALRVPIWNTCADPPALPTTGTLESLHLLACVWKGALERELR